jgi:hypothetical protein
MQQINNQKYGILKNIGVVSRKIKKNYIRISRFRIFYTKNMFASNLDNIFLKVNYLISSEWELKLFMLSSINCQNFEYFLNNFYS